MKQALGLPSVVKWGSEALKSINLKWDWRRNYPSEKSGKNYNGFLMTNLDFKIHPIAISIQIAEITSKVLYRKIIL